MQPNNLFLLDFLVYVAGIRVPASNVTLMSSFNGLPRCTFTLPPYSEFFGIGRNDKVPVHVFVRETFTGAPVDTQEYLLMFEGEIEGFGYLNSRNNREIVVNAQSHLTFLRDVSMKVLSAFTDFVEAVLPGQEFSALTSTGHAGFVYPISLFMQGPGHVEKGGENLVDTPTEFLKNTADFLLGRKYSTEGSEGFRPSRMAEFYRVFSEKLRLDRRFPELPYFDDISSAWNAEDPEHAKGFPLLSILQKSTALEVLTGLMSNGPQTGSIYDLINFVLNRIEYEFAFFSAPTYTRVDGVPRLHSMCLKPMFYEALPPTCNVIFPSMCQDIRAQESVYRVPTRIRMHDAHGVISNLTHRDYSILAKFGTLDFYPVNPASSERLSDSNLDEYARLILEHEGYTGPYLYDTTAPPWSSYVGLGSAGEEELLAFKRHTMKHLHMLKVYEARNMSVQCAFNPYLVPGMPAIVCDAHDTGFTFVGYVLTVNHHIGKNHTFSSVDLGFTRFLTDELNPDTRLRNTLDIVSDEVTHQYGPMSEIYQKIIGCPAVDIAQFYTDLTGSPEGPFRAVNDPTAAYRYNSRSIATLEQYMDFMGLAWAEGMKNSQGRYVPYVLDGAYVSERNTSLYDVRAIIKAISDKEFANEVYVK